MIWFTLFLSFISVASVFCKTVNIYVSPTGSDSNTGLDIHHPIQTLEKAKSKLDESTIKGNTVIVEMMKGYYDLSSTLHFTHKYTAPVTFRAYKGEEVHVTGGKRISASIFHKVTDGNVLHILPQVAHGKVMQVHLPDAGITDYGQITRFGFYQMKTAWLELFINGVPTRLAQYPNEGYIDITSVGSRNDTVFTHGSHEDSRWTHEKEPWAIGYWYWSWADNAVKISHIDPVHHRITLGMKNHYGLRVGHFNAGSLKGNSEQGGYFRVFNMLSELDQPGEYYIDRSTGILYVWPNTAHGTLSNTDIIYASLISDCIRVDHQVNNLHFEDFTLEACRRSGFEMDSARDIGLTNLQIRNLGAYGMHCHGDCRGVTVSRCDVHYTSGGLALSGGERKSLTSSGNLIEDNHIWQFSRVGGVGYHAISTSGVGATIRYNHLHDGQYTGIMWSGNDHIMEYNHIHHMCVNSSDCGAVHAGRDWTMRGNVIRYNHIHHVLRRVPGAENRAVMLDDQFSSATIEHNVFYENECHVDIGGGRDNVVRYNIFYDAKAMSIWVDGRGLRGSNMDTLKQRLNAMPYTNSLWAHKYPKLAHISHLGAPEGNIINYNVFFNQNGKKRVVFHGVQDKPEYFDHNNNHVVQTTNEFWSPKDADFRIRCAAAKWANTVNFPQAVDINHVGPRYQTGPSYMQKPLVTHKSTTNPEPCTSWSPRTPFYSDGSGPNTVYPNIPKHGCWLVVSGCPLHPFHGTQRDVWGEQHEQTAVKEENCLKRAAIQWKFCGASDKETVTAVFGPTGAMTIAGKHCYYASYGCPEHGGTHTGRLDIDSYGEDHGGLTDEAKCLGRAVGQYVWCGADPDHPYTSIYGPTGAKRTAGGGCWIKIASCPADHKLTGFFYDESGAASYDTGHDESKCLDRASYYWKQCGSHHDNPVTAIYRPSAKSKTVP